MPGKRRKVLLFLMIFGINMTFLFIDIYFDFQVITLFGLFIGGIIYEQNIQANPQHNIIYYRFI